jgi:hypothetical protein
MDGCLREVKIDYVVDDWVQISRQKTRLGPVGISQKTIQNLFEASGFLLDYGQLPSRTRQTLVDITSGA